MSLLSFQWTRNLRHEEVAKLSQALGVSAEAEGHSPYLSPLSLHSTCRALVREKAILYHSFLFQAVYPKVKFTSLPEGCFAGPFGRWFVILCKDLSDLSNLYSVHIQLQKLPCLSTLELSGAYWQPFRKCPSGLGCRWYFMFSASVCYLPLENTSLLCLPDCLLLKAKCEMENAGISPRSPNGAQVRH